MDDLETKLRKVLETYADDINSSIPEAVKKCANAAKGTLKSTSPRSKGKASFGSKHYADQWAVRQEIGRLSAGAIIYNKSPTYRLAHLLENGHAKRNGGRVAAIPHIKPVEETAVSMIESEIRRAI